MTGHETKSKSSHTPSLPRFALEDRAQALWRGPGIVADGPGQTPAQRCTSRRLTRAEEIHRLPWDEQLQVAQAASDEAKATYGRRVA